MLQFENRPRATPTIVLIDFILKEWLLLASGAGLLLTSLHAGHPPAYSALEIQVLFILFALLVTVKGLQRSGIIARIAHGMERGKVIPLKLVAATFFLSMLVTNDVALIVIVPLTLAIDIDRRDILVILEALAANAGSAFTPFGNPQNLFIYWFYDLHPAAFITSIAPFSSLFLVLLLAASLALKTRAGIQETAAAPAVHVSVYPYAAGLAIVLLSALHGLPAAAGSVVILYALLRDRATLRIDYPLLLTFFFFFGLAGNLQGMLSSGIRESGHVFLLSALASQIMSNVPATLLFTRFTTDWEALLWGANAGGFGSLFGSLANLIAYKIYITDKSTDNPASFTMKFLLFGYLAFFLAMGLYFSLRTT